MESTNGDASANNTVPLIINGIEERTSSTFPVISPYTAKECWSASTASPADAERAVKAAAEAFPAWSATKPAARRDVLLKAADLLESRIEENAAIMRTEMGADVGTSQFFVAPLAIRMLRDIAGRITSIAGSVPEVEEDGRSAIVYKVPMGVILGICPWNAPFVFAIRSAACALAAGNTTIIKGSELSPKCFWAVGKAFVDAGLPAGCLNVITCKPADAPAVIETIVAHEAVRKVNFTGSTATGSKIAAVCGRYLKPTLMELGGKNSAIVCADADLKLAVDAVLAGGYLNSGQICMATDRILVHKDIAPAFIEALKKALAASSKDSNEPPTLITAASKERVHTLVTKAVEAGARIEYGELESQKGCENGVTSIRMAPLLISNASDDMPIWQEEAFASLAAYRVVDSDADAIKIANQGGLGLSAAVFSEDLRKALAIAKQLESGAVHINSMTIHDEPVLPHGGVKGSGWGRFNAKEGLDEFLVSKTVTWKN